MTSDDHRVKCIEAMKQAMIKNDRFGVPDSFIYSMACAAFDATAYADLLKEAKVVIECFGEMVAVENLGDDFGVELQFKNLREAIAKAEET